jgi:predicted membrane-bound spermidine synthase
LNARSLASAVFFLSGVSALVYQVAWQRILALASGVSIYSITMIVGAFMAGLGTGSHLGGLLSTRLSPKAALRGFALLEIAIGLAGALSPSVYYDLLYLRGAHLFRSPWEAGTLHFAALLVPTALMGMSLPLLVRGVVRDAASAGRTIGTLYGINVLGAALGALLTPWLLIRFFGIRGAVLWAAAGNLAAGLVALLAQRLFAGSLMDGHEPAAVPTPGARRPFALWLLLYALSGFVALALEILWFRVMDVAVKSMAFTFGTVLFIYLLGSALGSLIGARLTPRARDSLRLFLLAQCAILVYSGLALGAVAWLPADTPVLAWFVEYWRLYDGFKLGQDWDLATLARLYLLQPMFLYGPPTLLMGLSFPILQGAVHDDPRTTGRKVGFLQAANIVGCVAGSLLVGLVALDRLGTTDTLRCLLGLGIGFAALGMVVSKLRVAFVALAAVLAGLIAWFPSQERFWLRLHGRAGDDSIADEDTTGVGAMTRVPWNRDIWNLSFNGKGQGSLPFFEGHVVMGAVPVLVHPEPREIAIVGLGTGGTAWAAACRKETRAITVFELSGSQPRLLERMETMAALPDLLELRRDPRVRLLVADGRNAIEHGDALYDVIEQDPIFPDRAFSGNLYSVEYFQRCARRLKPGGILCSWAPTPRIFAALAEAFPHLLGTPDRLVVLATREPLHVDLATWLARLDSQAVVDYLGEAAHGRIVNRLRKLQPLTVQGMWNVKPNRDLEPRDEFRTPE